MIVNSLIKKVISNIKKNKDKGQVTLFIAVSMTAFILYIGLYAINRSINEQRSLINTDNSIRSFYLADAGTERFLFELNRQINNPAGPYGAFTSLEDLVDCIDDDICNNTSNSSIALEGGLYNISATGNIIKSVGSYNKTSRAIELSYAP